MPLEVNLVNLVDVLQKVTNVDDLGLHLGVPKQELDKIRQDFHTKDEQKRNMLQWWLKNDLAEWEQVISALRAMKEPVLADAVAVVCKCESLCESPTKESPREAKMIKLLDEKLTEVQQRSQHLGKEWEKGEEQWHEFLKEMKKIEELWRDLVKSQQTERAFLTLGISLLDYSDLHQTDAMSEKAETLIATSRKLRKLYEKATEHRCGLQDTETELEEWEKALHEQVLELQKCIDQMVEDKFSGEAKNCREKLEKFRQQLRACRKKTSQCRAELTKPIRQLRRCQDKLTECEVSLKRCRDELGKGHSQITQCIEELKNQSQKLSEEIKTLTVAGGALGTAGGAGVAALFVGSLFGPVGLVSGALIGGAIASGGVVAGFQDKKEEKEETRKKLRRCEVELGGCGNVVERCSEALQKSEDKLRDLKRIVNELEQFFCRVNYIALD